MHKYNILIRICHKKIIVSHDSGLTLITTIYTVDLMLGVTRVLNCSR